MKDPYYNRYEVSNSDLNELWKYFHGPELQEEPVEAYRFGNLVDCMITEADKVNYLNYTCNGEQFNKDEFDKAYKMLQAVRNDPMIGPILHYFEGQRVFSREMDIDYGSFRFTLPCRCKFDLYSQVIKWGGDIKSTAATTQKQFEDACWHFGYHRQRAFYMDISEAQKDILIGISKVNFKVFKLPIDRSTEFYKAGHEEYSDLAFNWWFLFNDFKKSA